MRLVENKSASLPFPYVPGLVSLVCDRRLTGVSCPLPVPVVNQEETVGFASRSSELKNSVLTGQRGFLEGDVKPRVFHYC